MEEIKLTDNVLQGKDIIKELKEVLKKHNCTFGAIYYGSLARRKNKHKGIVFHIAMNASKYRAIYVLGSDNILVFDKERVKGQCKRKLISFKKFNNLYYFIFFGKMIKIC